MLWRPCRIYICTVIHTIGCTRRAAVWLKLTQLDRSWGKVATCACALLSLRLVVFLRSVHLVPICVPVRVFYWNQLDCAGICTAVRFRALSWNNCSITNPKNALQVISRIGDECKVRGSPMSQERIQWTEIDNIERDRRQRKIY